MSENEYKDEDSVEAVLHALAIDGGLYGSAESMERLVAHAEARIRELIETEIEERLNEKQRRITQALDEAGGFRSTSGGRIIRGD